MTKIVLKSEELDWRGVRFLDRNSKTFYYDGAFYKAIKPTALNFVKQKSFNFFLDALAGEGFIPKTISASIHIDGYEKVYRQHTEHFSLKLSECSALILKEAALQFLCMNRWLYKRGFVLQDGHTSNMIIQGPYKPLWCDFGSIYTTSECDGHGGMNEFIQYYLYPLLMRKKSPSLAQLSRHSCGAGMSHAAAKALNLYDEKIIFPEKFDDRIDFLEDFVRSIDFAWEKTLWSDYNAVLEADQFSDVGPEGSNRIGMIKRILTTLSPKTVVDLGANSGFYSRLAASLGAEVLAVELDDTAVARGYSYMRLHKVQYPIKFAVMGVGASVSAKGEVALALALTHHMYFTSQFSWQALAQTLAYYTEKHLLTEFMPNGLGMTKKPSSLPQDYTLDNFVRELQKYFESVQVFDYNLSKKSSPRIPILCTNKIN